MSDTSANIRNLPHCIVDDRWFDTTVVLCCSGELDLLTAPILERHIVATLEKKPSAMIVDLTDVAFLASSGMGVLLAASEQVSPGVRFSVVAIGPVTSRPMKLIGLDKVMAIHPTLTAALEDVSLSNSVPREQD